MLWQSCRYFECMSRAAHVDIHMLAPGFKHGLPFPADSTDSSAVLQVQSRSFVALLPGHAD